MKRLLWNTAVDSIHGSRPDDYHHRKHIDGSPVPQGSVPRVAVEGYANSQLPGGVVVDVVVPDYVPYFLHVDLPLIRK
jgi:hypothetical protein